MGVEDKATTTTLTRTTTEGCAPLEIASRRKNDSTTAATKDDQIVATSITGSSTTNNNNPGEQKEKDVPVKLGVDDGDVVDERVREKLGSVRVVNLNANTVADGKEGKGDGPITSGSPSPRPSQDRDDSFVDDVVNTLGIQQVPQRQRQRPPSQPGAYARAGINHQPRSGGGDNTGNNDDDGISVSMYTYHNQPGEDQQVSPSPPVPPTTTTTTSLSAAESAGLVEAQPVVEEEALPMAIDEAQPVHSEEGKATTTSGATQRTQSFMPLVYGSGLCVLLILLIGGIIAYLATSTTGGNGSSPAADDDDLVNFTSSSNDEAAATTTTTTTPFSVTEAGLVLNLTMLNLPNFTLRELYAGSLETSPHVKAYQWMQADPWLDNYTQDDPDHRLLQRFVAATFYYSTVGEEWTHNGSMPADILARPGKPPKPGGGGGGGGGPPPNGGSGGGGGGLPPSGGGGSGGNNPTTGSRPLPSNTSQAPQQQQPPTRKRRLLREDDDDNNSNNSTDIDIDIVYDSNVLFKRDFINYTSKAWLSYEDNECDWFSIPNPVELCYKNRFVNLDLHNNNLQNTLPQQIGLLTHLQGLILHKNKGLRGTIPTMVGHLTKLKLFSFGETQMSGTLPSQLGLLTQLQTLAVLQSQHTGAIPTEIWQLSKLERFMVAFNKFTGTLPWDLGHRMPLLNFVLLGRTHLKGTLPDSLGFATNMGEFAVKASQFSGTIPSTFGLWSQATKIDLSLNNFSGRIPEELGTGLLANKNIKLFFLNGNNLLTGPLPTDMAKWNASQILKFEIQGTGITGTIPENLCRIEGLKFDCSDTLCGCHCNCTG